MHPGSISDNSAAALIATFLKARGVSRIFGLCGGHIMPLWMRFHLEGIQIVDVRDERAAVFMAHAHAELTGSLGVALVTAGPGVTNAMTGIANAHTSRVPILVLSGVPPRPQENRGALQDMVHTDLLRSLTRYARTVRHPDLVLQELDEAVSRAFGHGGADPGPAYLDFPVDTLRDNVTRAVQLKEHLLPKAKPRLVPDSDSITKAVEVLFSARRPLFISGRGARGAGAPLRRLIDQLNALYLDTGESRGLIPDSHPSVVTAMRGSVMTQADLIITVGRRLDFQLGYGSPAIFGDAQFLRLADCTSELRDNRRGTVELFGSVADSLEAILEAAVNRNNSTDLDWTAEIRTKHLERSAALQKSMENASPGSDGLMHPNRILAALRLALPDDAIVVADGGDFLSFTRVGLPVSTYLDPGSLGCIGIGTPFGVSASLAKPDQTVVVVTGDGSFGFNAMEMDTAVRHNAPVLIVVANNGSWAIEVRDQLETHGMEAGTRLRFSNYAMMAQSLGMYAERVVKAEDLPAAIQKALENRPALLDVLVTPEAASSDSRSGLAWVPDLQPLAAWDLVERKWRADI